MNPAPTPDLYALRRARLAAELGPAGIAIVPTAPERQRNRDNGYPFRHDSYFYYLTGFTEPGAWLVLDHTGRSTLFCQPKDQEREIWDGLRLGPAAAPAALGVSAAHPVTEIDTALPRLLENSACLWYPFATHAGLAARVDGWLDAVRARQRHGAQCPARQGDLCALLDEMRLFKDAHEQNLMRRASQISAQAHVRAMQRAARELRAGRELREYQLEAELLHAFRDAGAQSPAYNAIVAAGANACVLHYRADSAPLRAGELVLIDAGCELDGYASDITRSFPASGRFTPAQRALYELVLASQQAALAATRAGARFNDPHEAAVAVLAQGLLDLGLLNRDQAGTRDDVIASRAYFRFYMHRTSHWIGMDVHDCGSYLEPGAVTAAASAAGSGAHDDPARGQPASERPGRVLQPGMVLTIEPGLYVRAAADVPERFHNTGIRIEDDAIVTATGCELITRGVPVAPDEIEALMND